MTNSRANAVTLGTEQSTSPTADDTEGTMGGGRHYVGAPFTLGTSGKLYLITAIEFKTGTTANTTVFCGLIKANASPPTDTTIEVLAYTKPQLATSTATTYKTPMLYAPLIEGGILVAPYINTTGNPKMRNVAISSENIYTDTGTEAIPPILLHTAETWTAGTLQFYMKVYYKAV